MLHSKKGSIYLESLISLILLFGLIVLVIQMNGLFGDIENSRLEYKMKQQFYLNKALLEDDNPLTNCLSCTLYIIEKSLCIEWTDYYGKQKQYCEIYLNE